MTEIVIAGICTLTPGLLRYVGAGHTKMAEGLAEATSAAAGALTSALVFYPLDLVKTRIQSQLGSDDGASQYKGIADGFVQILRAHSVGGLYEGLGGYSLKTSVDNFTYFFWRRFMMNSTARILGHELSGLAELVISNVAGILHKLLNLPLDVVSTRQQTARNGSTMLANAKEVVKLKGWGGLWDGLGPTLLLTTNPAITYTCFDFMKRGLIGRRAKLVRTRSGTAAARACSEACCCSTIMIALAQLLAAVIFRESSSPLP